MPSSLLDTDSLLYAPPLVQRRRGELFLLLDPEGPNWLSTNEAGARLLRLCDGRHTLEDLASADSLGDSQAIIGFLGQAAEVGFVSPHPSVVPPYRGRAQAIEPGRLDELWIYTNNSCHLRCLHCLVSAGEETTRQMRRAELRSLIDQAAALGVSRFYFTGGEPFLRKDLLELVEHGLRHGEVIILTSGTLLDDEAVARLALLAERGSLLLQVSLEGPDAETNDAIRGEGSFEPAVDAIRRLVSAGMAPVVTTTIMSLNHHRVADTTRFLATLGVKDHHVLWLHPRGRLREGGQSLLVPGWRVGEIMDELSRVSREVGLVVDNAESLRARVRTKRGRKNDLCNCAYSMLSVDADGQVYPCAALSGAPEFAAGSVAQMSLEEVWLKSARLQWIRENSVQRRVGCSACALKYLCGGGCFAQSYYQYEIDTGEGCIMAPDPYCEAYQGEIWRLLWELASEGVEPGERQPRLYNAMDTELLSCAQDGNRVIDAAHEVGTYHCSCVLAIDLPDPGPGTRASE